VLAKLQDIKPGTQIHVYVNEGTDKSLGTKVGDRSHAWAGVGFRRTPRITGTR